MFALLLTQSDHCFQGQPVHVMLALHQLERPSEKIIVTGQRSAAAGP